MLSEAKAVSRPGVYKPGNYSMATHPRARVVNMMSFMSTGILFSVTSCG